VFTEVRSVSKNTLRSRVLNQIRFVASAGPQAGRSRVPIMRNWNSALFARKVEAVIARGLLRALQILVLLAIFCGPPIVPLLAAWGRWNGREILGLIELESSTYYPRRHSRSGLTALISVTVSIALLPIVLVFLEGNVAMMICVIGVISALIGMFAALMARPGIRGMVFLSAIVCLFWSWVVVGSVVSPRVASVPSS
jgi:hypothetical protein